MTLERVLYEMQGYKYIQYIQFNYIQLYIQLYIQFHCKPRALIGFSQTYTSMCYVCEI